MARLTYEQINKVKERYGVDRLWSWSKINTYMTSPYEYYLSYVAHEKQDNDNCAYAPIGSCVHDRLERYYTGVIKYEDMLDEFEDGWLTSIDLADLKFDRNDEEKNESIKEKYKADVEHFFKNHKRMSDKVICEKFVTAKIGDNVLQGYIDAIFKDENGVYNIIDHKTSSKFSSKAVEEKSGQLTVYAIALTQLGVPLDKIRIGFQMVKYCTVTYHQKNGAVKTRDVERYKLGESLVTNAKMWLKAEGYSEDEVDDYLKLLIDSNDISCLPEEVAAKYELDDCYIWVPLTQKLVDKWTDTVISTIKDIEAREDDYKETGNEKVFWDTPENVKKESYYFATLCGYSARLHKPYGTFLDELEKQKQGVDFFSGVGSSVTESTPASEDLSWLNEIL